MTMKAILAGAMLLTLAAPAIAGERVAIRVGDSPFANASTHVQPTISIDSLWLAQPEVFTAPQSTIARHLATLADGYPVKRLRVGAIGADKTYWSRRSEREDPTPAWAVRGRIGPAGLTALDQLSRDAGGYGIVLHTNLEHSDARDPGNVARMTDYVVAAHDRLGNRLSAVMIGNEPDLFRDATGKAMPPATFWSQWETYANAFKARVPGLALYGPATAKEFELFNDFVERQARMPSIAALSSHDYYLSMCRPEAIKDATVERLLSFDLYQTTRVEAGYVAMHGRRLGVPAVWDERNSASCAGTPGVGDVYAASLWGLDSTLLIARSGIARQYLHSAFGVCGGEKPQSTYYSAFCAPTAEDAKRGRIRAMPLYYGLLAAHLTGDGVFLNSDVTRQSQARLRFYALRQDKRLTLVLVNMENSATPAKVTVPARYRQAVRADLTGPGLEARDGITLGGGTMDATGRFSGAKFTPVALSSDGRTVDLAVPAYSAAIVRLD